jgi:hypothetical protein
MGLARAIGCQKKKTAFPSVGIAALQQYPAIRRRIPAPGKQICGKRRSIFIRIPENKTLQT